MIKIRKTISSQVKTSQGQDQSDTSQPKHKEKLTHVC